MLGEEVTQSETKEGVELFLVVIERFPLLLIICNSTLCFIV